MRWLGLSRLGTEEHLAEIKAELDARTAALDEVAQAARRTVVAERELPAEVVELLRTRNMSRTQVVPRDLEDALARMRLSAA